MLPDIADARVWTFPPNWSARPTERYEFKTDIFTSRSGREQRRALRDQPRRSHSYQVTAAGDDFRALNLFLRTGQNQPVAAPEWTRYAKLSADVAATATTLTFAATPAWMVVGRAVMLLTDSTYHVAVIEATTSTTVTLDTPLTDAWLTGSRVYAALLVLLNETMQGAHLTNAVTRKSLMLSVFPGSEPAIDDSSAVTTFNGREVFTQTPNWSSDVSMDHSWAVETVDFGRGRIQDFRPVVFPASLRKATYLHRTASDIEAIVQFFCRQQGRRGAFYAPTGDDDLKLEATASAGGTTLTVSAGRSTSLLIPGAGGYEDAEEAICVRLVDGTQYYRLITGVSGSGATRVLTCSGGTWPVTLSSVNVSGISWMPLCRFAADILEITWLSDAVGQTQLAIQSIMTE